MIYRVNIFVSFDPKHRLWVLVRTALVTKRKMTKFSTDCFFFFNFYIFRKSLYIARASIRSELSRPIRKPTICICENKGADQLRGNREADHRRSTTGLILFIYLFYLFFFFFFAFSLVWRPVRYVHAIILP